MVGSVKCLSLFKYLSEYKKVYTFILAGLIVEADGGSSSEI